MDHLDGGSRVSHYQLVRKLGSGGMGDVYLADDLELGRPVAIKFLNAPADEHARHRLLNEAKAAASLDHASICAVYEVGRDEAHGDFIVMQYVEGETLASVLGRGPLSREATLSLAADVAEALAVAHRQGVIHRDLKPHNIVMQPSGRAKLLDFGIAKRLTSEQEVAQAITSTQLTGSNATVGTPGYMAPEQVRGQPADARSDLFALGCVLYECMAGRRAFPGLTSGEISGQVLHAEPAPLSSIVPGGAPDLEAFIARLLRKAPADRFQSANEAVGAIRTLRGLTTRDHSTTGTHGGPFIGPRSARPYLLAITALVVVLVSLTLWMRGRSLPTPPPEAVRWYDQGVEALRDGAYVEARTALEEAVHVFPEYALAYSRLADACAELDDDAAAQTALLRMAALVTDARLPRDERLRVDAVRALVLREYDEAIKAFTALLDRHPGDAGLWVDAGRALEKSGRMAAARDHYAKAVAVDPQSASARLRLGNAEGQTGDPVKALAEFDEAIRLYRAASRVEGEADALTRKAARQSSTGDYAGARESLERAIAVTADARYLAQRLRAHFQLARARLAEGQFTEAERIAAEAVAQATSAGLDRDAADGLIDLSNILVASRRIPEADEALVRAISQASKKSARRTEMRARLQQANLRLQTNQFEEAVKLASAPMKFFAEGKYAGLEAQAKNTVSRAKEYLEEYDDAQRLASDVLRYAESVDNKSLIGESLESLAGQLTRLGRLPEALRYRERIEAIHRNQGDHAALKFDLPNHAELLIRLGRGREAAALLDEVRRAIAQGHPAYMDRARRVGLLAALLASTERKYADVEALATVASDDAAAKADSTAIYARVLREHARAQLDRSREKPAVIAEILAQASPAPRRELAYWVAQTLLARREPDLALAVVAAELSSPVIKDNAELKWRLAAIAERAVRAGGKPVPASAYQSIADDEARRMNASWGGDATAYFARPDLALLRQPMKE